MEKKIPKKYSRIKPNPEIVKNPKICSVKLLYYLMNTSYIIKRNVIIFLRKKNSMEKISIVFLQLKMIL